MTRPPLDPVTLRWLADELDASASETAAMVGVVPESQFRDLWITRHTRDAERLRRQARRLRELAEEEERRASAKRATRSPWRPLAAPLAAALGVEDSDE